MSDVKRRHRQGTIMKKANGRSLSIWLFPCNRKRTDIASAVVAEAESDGCDAHRLSEEKTEKNLFLLLYLIEILKNYIK